MSKPMKRLRNRFNILLAEKAFLEGKSRISQRDVAKATGLAKATVDRFASNAITMYDNQVLIAMCEYLGCTPGDLLVIEEIENPERGTPQLAVLAG